MNCLNRDPREKTFLHRSDSDGFYSNKPVSKVSNMRIPLSPMIRNFLLFAVTLPFFAVHAWAKPASTPHVEAEIVFRETHAVPGQELRAGLRLKMADHWHTYWQFAGDAGLPTRIKWELPPGFTPGEIQWPYPIALDVAGVINLVHEGELVLPINIAVPMDAQPGSVTGRARVSWLVCDDKTCIPEKLTLDFEIPIAAEPAATAAAFSPLFEQADRNLPLASSDWKLSASRSGDTFLLQITPPAGVSSLKSVQYFPFDHGVTLLAAPQPFEASGGSYALKIAADPNAENPPANLQGVLVADPAWTADGLRKSLAINLPVSSEPGGSAPSEKKAEAAVFFLAFLGGLILNLMPCVFPVLGLKIISFVKQAGEDKRVIKMHGLVFTAGVLVSFWLLSGLLIVLRSSGQELGWGFQLQSPGFVAGLMLLLFVFGLNLSGLFEFGIGLTAAGQSLSGKKGFSGSFFSGVLATVVATPCAAPILAPVLGAALALPALPSLGVFTTMALGLAFPYLFFSAFPNLLGKLPRPGAWMETFKQVMAFLLYATAAFLLWVLEGQVTSNGLLSILMALVFAALGVWLYGKFQFSSSLRSKWIARAGVLITGGLALWLTLQGIKPDSLNWEPWSESRVAELTREGRPIYVDFTARWCTTCQVNKKAVFSSSKVLETFRDMNMAMLKADWTSEDPAITRGLESFGRSAVPFNLYYPPGASEPVILPEILTPGVVLKAIENGKTN